MSYLVSVQHADGGEPVVVIEGEADVAAAPAMRQQLNQVLAAGPDLVLVDLSGATFIDSTAIRALLDAQHDCRATGGSVRLVCRDPRITNTLGYAGVDRELPAFPTRGEALARDGAS